MKNIGYSCPKCHEFTEQEGICHRCIIPALPTGRIIKLLLPLVVACVPALITILILWRLL